MYDRSLLKIKQCQINVEEHNCTQKVLMRFFLSVSAKNDCKFFQFSELVCVNMPRHVPRDESCSQAGRIWMEALITARLRARSACFDIQRQD
jgi:hypothetical protein